MIKQLRYWWWLTRALLTKHLKIVLVAAAASILLLIGLFKFQSGLSFTDLLSSRKIGLIGRYRVDGLPLLITEKISLGLTTVAADGSVSPGLATSWELTENDTNYIFRIDTGASWHDTTLVKAADVISRIENVAVEVPDDETVVFKLKEPYAPFPSLLTKPIFKKELVGVGEWRVKSLVRNGEFVDRLTLVNPVGQRLEYRFYRTTSDLITALKLGEISQIEDLTSKANLPDWAELVIESQLHLDRYLAVFLNTNDAYLNEKSFRQALAYAIGNKAVPDLRALSPISPESWAYNPQVKPYDPDLKLARELLSSVVDKDEKPTLELTTTLPHLDRAEEIARDWTKLGVETKVKVATVIPDEFQALLIGQQRPPDPDQYYLWHSTQTSNITHFSSPKVDKLLEDGRKTLDQKKRIEIYRDFQRFLLEECPAIFLEHITTFTVKRNVLG